MHAPYALLALLQTAPATARPGGSTIFMIQIVAVFVIFYFWMIRPQQKQRKKHESALMELKKGDEIVTAGGIIGRVVHIKESVVDGAPKGSLTDAVTIQSAESRLIVERGRIARVGTTETGAPGA